MSTFHIPLLSQLAHALYSAGAAFFKLDISLRRADDGLRVMLRERENPAKVKSAAITREEAAAEREKQELTLMQAQLGELLNEQPETRHAMRHLVFVEQAITKKGLKALHKLPVDVLQRALEQMDGLVTNWSPVGLASLRSKMAVAIIDREHMDPDAVEADRYRTAAVMDSPSVQPAAPIEERSDDEALAAAYAVLGSAAPTAVEMQGELNSPVARAMRREAARSLARSNPAPASIHLRESNPAA